ncbi:MAG: hypothetical protein QOD42_3047 [Sphingomonadales bacterium]|nr:hypothetical protein [Sphingomonadales bacterium]
MRRGLTALLLLAATCTACAPAGGNNVQDGNAAAAAGAADPVAVVTVAAPGGACAFTWNGNPATRAAIVAQGDALARATIRERGGIAAMTERTFPYARVEAAAALPFDCVALALGDLQRAGFPSVTLRLAGGGGAADHRAYVMNGHDGPYNPRAIAMMGTGARLAWNEEEIDLATLRARARALRGKAVTPDDFVLVPAGDTDFGAVHAAVGTVRAAGLDLYLAGCAREASDDPRTRAVWGSTRPPPHC